MKSPSCPLSKYATRTKPRVLRPPPPFCFPTHEADRPTASCFEPLLGCDIPLPLRRRYRRGLNSRVSRRRSNRPSPQGRGKGGSVHACWQDQNQGGSAACPGSRRRGAGHTRQGKGWGVHVVMFDRVNNGTTAYSSITHVGGLSTQ